LLARCSLGRTVAAPFRFICADHHATSVLVFSMTSVSLFIFIDFYFKFRSYFGLSAQPLPDMLHISYDHAFPELFNYFQALAIVALLGLTWRISQRRMLLFWAATFTLVLIDDAFVLHERLGRLLVHHGWVGALPGLRAQDSGELLVWFGLALLLVGLLIWAFREDGSRGRGDAHALVPLFGLLVACAVGGDMLHGFTAGQGWSVVAALVGYLEDGGEMVALALTLAVSVALWRRAGRRADHHDLAAPPSSSGSAVG
jgi:hypothetical protein